MPSFWSFISNDQYSIGCTGQTVYVYDHNGNQLARFKDLPYGYTSLISPKGDIFVVKSTAGRMAVYSLKELKLIKKFRFSQVDCSQDDNFCFSPDGEKLYNIERHIESYETALSIYSTKDFLLEKRLFLNDHKTNLNTIEYDEATSAYYVLGFWRGGEPGGYFVARLCDDELSDCVSISENEYMYYHGYKSLEFSGFTEKAKEWSAFRYDGYDLRNIEMRKHSLAKLWQYYFSAGK
ncbi:MAG: hypothetical protein ACI3YK_02000 [Eubacteriales bacterium]